MDFHFKPIGIVHSCFTQKFGIPRQPGIATRASAAVELFPEYGRSETMRGLEDFSHIWIVFVFHQHMEREWKPTVRPPRLGGNARIGVFASRSIHRPNPIGISSVRLLRIEHEPDKTVLHVSGTDLLDGTPVLDIKPYIPYADAITDAQAAYAAEAPQPVFEVYFSEAAQASCEQLQQSGYTDFCELIIQLLQTDPRPAYYSRSPTKNDFALRLWDVDVHWMVRENEILVTALERVTR